MKKIGIIVFSMSRVGGTERVVNILARRLSKDYSVTIFELEHNSERDFYISSQAVKVISCASSFEGYYLNMFLSMLRVVWLIYKHRIDFLYSTFGSISILAILLMPFKRVVVCDHACFKVGMNGVVGKIRKCLYKFADAVVSLTESDKKLYELIGCNAVVIENPLSPDFVASSSFCDNGKMIAVGRLTKAKNFFRLIDVARELKKHKPDFHLDIYGEGELLADLLNYIELSGLSDNVKILKPIQNIRSAYAEAAILLMTSDYEALPMTLIEAQAMGLPCVSFDIETGPKEIIIDGKTGFLIPDGDLGLYVDKVVELLDSVELRRRMYHSSIEYSKRYDIEKVYLKWKALIDA